MDEGFQLVVSEVFGPTFQGEGPGLGRRAAFVRLGRCNLACTWCDTAYTWDWSRYDPAEELHVLAVGEVVERVEQMRVDAVVVSGGEPLLQQRPLGSFLAAAKDRGWWVEVETAGTVAPELAEGLVDRYNVSPKLAASGNAEERRLRPDVLRAFEATGRAVFKFVVAGAAELDEVRQVVDECGLGEVWVMAEGTDAGVVADRTRALAGPVLARGWNLTTRLHVLVWGNRRGV